MIFKLEIKKIFRLRLFWIIITAFIIFNTFIIITNYSYIGDGTKIINSYIQSGNQPVDDVYHFCDNFDYAKENAVHDYYDNLSAQLLLKMAHSFFKDKNNNTVNKIVEKNYEKVEKRIQQIKSNGEAEDIYYVGTTFELHNELYGIVLYLVLIECLAMAVLMTAYLLNYEEIYVTHQNIYSSKRGRSIIFFKSIASIIATVLVSIIISVVTLFVFFYKIPHLWSFLQSSVSSAMATENRMIVYPFITWVKMSQLQYLFATLVLMIVYTILASLITFALSFVSKNTFINIILTIIVYFIFFAIWFGFPNETVLSFIQAFNPSIAMYNLKSWFMEFVLSPMTSYQGYETIVALTYLLLTVIIIIPLWKYFKKKDIA